MSTEELLISVFEMKKTVQDITTLKRFEMLDYQFFGVGPKVGVHLCTSM